MCNVVKNIAIVCFVYIDILFYISRIPSSLCCSGMVLCAVRQHLLRSSSSCGAWIR